MRKQWDAAERADTTTPHADGIERPTCGTDPERYRNLGGTPQNEHRCSVYGGYHGSKNRTALSSPALVQPLAPFLAILIAAVLTAAGLLMIWEMPMDEPENTTTIPQTNPPR
jgi:hypothetical protein